MGGPIFSVSATNSSNETEICKIFCGFYLDKMHLFI